MKIVNTYTLTESVTTMVEADVLPFGWMTVDTTAGAGVASLYFIDYSRLDHDSGYLLNPREKTYFQSWDGDSDDSGRFLPVRVAWSKVSLLEIIEIGVLSTSAAIFHTTGRNAASPPVVAGTTAGADSGPIYVRVATCDSKKSSISSSLNTGGIRSGGRAPAALL